MRAPVLPSRASHAALLLVLLCLQLGARNAQEDSWQVMTLDLRMPQSAGRNEEVPVTLRLETDLEECMVVKAYLRSSRPIGGTSSYQFTGCLCKDYPRSFFWDIQSNYTVQIAGMVDIVRELNICPEDRAVVPIKANRLYTVSTLQITS